LFLFFNEVQKDKKHYLPPNFWDEMQIFVYNLQKGGVLGLHKVLFKAVIYFSWVTVCLVG